MREPQCSLSDFRNLDIRVGPGLPVYGIGQGHRIGPRPRAVAPGVIKVVRVGVSPRIVVLEPIRIIQQVVGVSGTSRPARAGQTYGPGILVEAHADGRRVHRVELQVGRGVGAVEQRRKRVGADREADEGGFGQAVGIIAHRAVSRDQRVAGRVVLAAVIADKQLGPPRLHRYGGVPLVGLRVVVVDRDPPGQVE